METNFDKNFQDRGPVHGGVFLAAHFIASCCFSFCDFMSLTPHNLRLGGSQHVPDGTMSMLWISTEWRRKKKKRIQCAHLLMNVGVLHLSVLLISYQATEGQCCTSEFLKNPTQNTMPTRDFKWGKNSKILGINLSQHVTTVPKIEVPHFSQTSIESDVGVILPMLHLHVVVVSSDIPNSTNE